MYRFCCRTASRKLFASPTLTGATQWSPMLLHHVARPAMRPRLAVRSVRTTPRLSNAPRATIIQNTTKPFEPFPHEGPVPPNNVLKALLFTGAFSIGCFLGATVLEYENARSLMMEKVRKAKFPWPLQRSAKQTERSKWSQIKQELGLFWDRLSPGERVFVPICALNLLVFGMWRVPALKHFMINYFTSNPVGRAICWPMFLSTFSHYSAFHLFANMYVLHSFSNAAVISMGKEQFLAVYLSAGVIASMSSIFYKAITANAGISLGASGAIMAVLGYVCHQYPETQLSILFLPGITFSAASAIKVIIGIDLAGCLMGWKFFDHAAHLGGVLFGSFWAFYGADIWRRRVKFLSLYHDWRKTK